MNKALDSWCILPTPMGDFRMYDTGDEALRVIDAAAYPRDIPRRACSGAGTGEHLLEGNAVAAIACGRCVCRVICSYIELSELRVGAAGRAPDSMTHGLLPWMSALAPDFSSTSSTDARMR